MCWYLHLITVRDCDMDALHRIAARHGFAPTEGRGDAVAHVPGYRTLLPYDVLCDCETEVGSAFREQCDEARLLRLADKGRRKHWSPARREAWILQKLGAARRGEGTDLGRSRELEGWCALAEDAAASPAVGPIGILKLWAGESVDPHREVERASATASILRHLRPGQPTLLMPA